MAPVRLPLLILAGAIPLTAATRTWTGGDPSNTNWGDPDNWNTAAAAGDDLVFPTGIAAADMATVQSFVAGTAFPSLTFQAVGYSVSGNSFALGGGTQRFITVTSGIGTSTVGVPVSLGGDATFASTGSRATLHFTQAITLNGHKLTLNAANGNVQLDGAPGGTGRIEKTGAGTATLAAGALVSQATNVISGRLIVNGPLNQVTNVLNGATLAGTGSFSTVESFGAVAPGGNTTPSHATMQCSGTFTFEAGSTYEAELGQGANDMISAAGPVLVFNTSTLSPQIPENIPFVRGATFRIIDKTSAGAIGGNFGNAPDGAPFDVGRVTFVPNYAGGTGNDLVLTVTEIDPSGITRVWDGGGADNLCSTPANWVGDIAPGGGDALHFPVGAARPVSVNDLPSGFVFAGIKVDSGAYVFTGNSFTLDGPLDLDPDDADLVFGLGFEPYPRGISAPTVTHTGTFRSTLSGTIGGSNPAAATILSNAAPSGPGLHVSGSLSLGTLVLRDTPATPFTIACGSASTCGTLVVIAGDVEFTGGSILDATNAIIGDPGDLPGLSGGPATVKTIAASGSPASLLNTQNLQLAASSKLRFATGATVIQPCGQLSLAKGSMIESSGASQAVTVNTATALPGTDATIGVPIIPTNPLGGFNIPPGAVIRAAGTISFFGSASSFFVGGGGTLRLTAATAVSEITVFEGSTVLLDGASSGSASTDILLGDAGTPGHLGGNGTAHYVFCRVASCSVSPGTPESPYGVLTCHALSSTGNNFNVNLQIAGLVPGGSHDQIVVREYVDYANMGGITTFSPSFAPPAGSEVVLIDPDPLATVDHPPADSPFSFLGQKFLSRHLGGDGNDRTINKLELAAPLLGSAAGLPAAHIQPAVPPGLAQFVIPAKGESGLGYRLEYSQNLTSWSLSPTEFTAGAGGLFTVVFPVDPQTEPRLFFRLRPK